MSSAVVELYLAEQKDLNLTIPCILQRYEEKEAEEMVRTANIRPLPIFI